MTETLTELVRRRVGQEATLVEVPADGMPDFAYVATLGVRFSTPLSRADQTKLVEIVRYAWTEKIRTADAMGAYFVDGYGVTFFDAFMLHSPRLVGKPGANASGYSALRESIWREFVTALRTYVAEGTPIRTTDRKGAGTRGTRLVEGLEANGAMSLWADHVVLLPTKIELDLSVLDSEGRQTLIALLRETGIYRPA